MPRKRKSVTFREKISVIYPKTFDGSFSPAPDTHKLAAAAQSISLDPMYVNWLRLATKVHFPFIRDGTFATQVYLQNFDEHVRTKTIQDVQRAQGREAAVPPLAEKYGSLGWGNLYREVSEKAWVKNYREIYRFDGPDEYLLEKMAQAYDEIKHAIAEEESARALSTHYESINNSVSERNWEPVTQGMGALTSPNFGPGGVNVTFDNETDAPFDEDEPVQFDPDNLGGNRNGMSFGMDGVSRDCGNTTMSARTGPRMLGAGPGDSRWGYQTR